MGYSVKKAGVAFKAKVETNADLTGQSDGFSAFYIKDADGSKVDVSGSFTEDDNAAGVYFSPAITIDEAGDYTLVITNSDIGMDNHPTPLVVTRATIDDVKDAIDELRVVADTVAADVDGLDGQNLQDIKDGIAAVRQLINDTKDVRITIAGDETAIVVEGATITGDTSGATGTVSEVSYDSDADETTALILGVEGSFETDETVNDGTDSTTGKITAIVVNTVNSVLEFVEAVNSAIEDGATGLAALAGYTDDVENMLLGTEKLANGDDNPLYGANNADLKALMETLVTNLDDSRNAISDKMDNAKAEIIDKVDAVKAVVDANKAILEDSGYGLDALKGKLDTLSSDLASDKDDIMAVITEETKGLVGIYDTMVSRFDSVDSQLSVLSDKIDDLSTSQGFTAFI